MSFCKCKPDIYISDCGYYLLTMYDEKPRLYKLEIKWDVGSNIQSITFGE